MLDSHFKIQPGVLKYFGYLHSFQLNFRETESFGQGLFLFLWFFIWQTQPKVLLFHICDFNNGLHTLLNGEMCKKGRAY